MGVGPEVNVRQKPLGCSFRAVKKRYQSRGITISKSDVDIDPTDYMYFSINNTDMAQL